MSETYPHLHILIVCDKSSVALWPLTRTDSPIELVTMEGDHQSLLAREVAFCIPLSSEPVHIACDSTMTDAIRSHLVEHGKAARPRRPEPAKSGKTARQLEMELLDRSLFDPGEIDIMPIPVDRGTAFSVALAASQIKMLDPNAIILVLRSDIRFVPDELWEAAIGRAYRAAAEDYIAVIGVKPAASASTHGYIRRGAQLPGILNVYRAVDFTEDPPAALSARMQQLATYWDSGIFMTRASVALAEMHNVGSIDASSSTLDAQDSTRIAETAGFLAALGRDHWSRPDARTVASTLPRATFASAVLEASERVAVVDSSLSWQCISSLGAIDELSEKDEGRNHMTGNVISTSTTGSTIYAQGRLIAAHGLHNMLVIDTPDALLVASKDYLASIGELHAAAAQAHVPELDEGPVSWYPWGSATALSSGEGYRVSRLEVTPQSQTPAATSHTTSESLAVVSGKGTLRIGEKVLALEPGISATVDAGEFFTLEACGQAPLVIIDTSTAKPRKGNAR